jgi:hypothetical protein
MAQPPAALIDFLPPDPPCAAYPSRSGGEQVAPERPRNMFAGDGIGEQEHVAGIADQDVADLRDGHVPSMAGRTTAGCYILNTRYRRGALSTLALSSLLTWSQRGNDASFS